MIGAIGQGILILLGVAKDDTVADGEWLAHKCAGLRIFADEAGHMNRSVRDVGGQALVVSQFTLIASTAKGTRPSFNDAARPELAISLYEDFVKRMEVLLGLPVPTGKFGAMMAVALENDGPVTIVIDSKLRE